MRRQRPDGPAASGLVLPLDRTERLIGRWRRRHVAGPGAAVPTHVTLAYPLPPTAALGDAAERWRALFAAEPGFDLTLGGFGRFPAAGVLYLAPQPVATLTRLAEAAFAACPGAAPDFPDPVFHATLSHGPAPLDGLERDAMRRLGEHLPIVERIGRAALYTRDAGGEWRLGAVFPLST